MNKLALPIILSVAMFSQDKPAPDQPKVEPPKATSPKPEPPKIEWKELSPLGVALWKVMNYEVDKVQAPLREQLDKECKLLGGSNTQVDCLFDWNKTPPKIARNPSSVKAKEKK